MKQTLEYKPYGRPASRCEVEVHDNVVVATELDDNPGVSITNAAEVAASAACRRFGIDPHALVWIEHYQQGAAVQDKAADVFFTVDESYDLVRFTVAENATAMPLGTDNLFSNPVCSRISKAHVQALTREDL